MFNPQPKHKRIKLTRKKYTELRKALHWRAGGYCEKPKCLNVAPLYIEDYAGELYFDESRCGHCSHDKSVGAGGDDTLENTIWSCPACHFAEHGPQWRKEENDT